MRLIDADALMQSEVKRCGCIPTIGSGYNNETSFKQILDNASTIEAEPVKHGRWVDRYGGKYVNPKYECSECRKEAPYRPKLDDLLNWYHEQDLSDYCPNCGAKMDGKENNSD